MWQIELTRKAQKEIRKLDPSTQRQIVTYLEQIIADGQPQNFGKALLGELSGYWRYRIGKYRIICEIQHQRLVVEVISVGTRDKIYR